jgi:hypothetical protein
MDLDQLRNPQRIAKAAIGLGMVQAGNPAFLELGTGKVTGVPSPGDGTTALRINPLPPKKPALLNPPAHVVTVTSEESHDTGQQSTGNSQHRSKNHQ